MRISDSASRRKWGGLITRQERWGFSWRGYAALGLLAISAGLVFVLTIYTFFARTDRVETRILVMEGWIQGYAIRAAAEEFGKGSYERVLTTGGPVVGTGGYINDYNTTASVGADSLKGAGVPAHLVQMVPARVNDRDRTYSSAVALRVWGKKNGVPLTSFNVLTEAIHARRTRMLFRNAFGDDVKIGIVAVKNPDYDGRLWWRYSDGVRSVLGECIAYSYAKLFFHPPAAPR